MQFHAQKSSVVVLREELCSLCIRCVAILVNRPTGQPVRGTRSQISQSDLNSLVDLRLNQPTTKLFLVVVTTT
jgi:hypothetical protein